MKNVRVRFAPSPTGSLHIGGARTALFNWMFARRHGGTFVLRIEDTDQERSREESTRAISDGLGWLGIDWDEGPGRGGEYGPYFQSQRLELYQKHARQLVDRGLAYHCYCTAEELAERREQARLEGRPPRYDLRCRDLSATARERCIAEGRKPVLRLKVPGDGTTAVEDIIRGSVSFDNAVIDDFVILKSDGMPTYNFACVVDDVTMGINYVIRAEEHLSNTPKQILLYQAFGYPLPNFAHVPMILAPDRSKLSKRHGATSVQEFRDQGYLPEAIVNYLALLGWSPEGDTEIMPLEDMVRQFSLERVSRNAAIYDVKKLTWINGHYLREGDIDRVTGRAIPFLQRAGLIPDQVPGEMYPVIRQIVGAVRDRVKTLAEIPEATSYFFIDDYEYEEKGVRKSFARPGVAELLAEARQRLEGVDELTAASAEAAYRELIDERGISGGELIHPTRLALTGRTMGPGLFDVVELLGKDRVLARLDRAVRFIRSLPPAAGGEGR